MRNRSCSSSAAIFLILALLFLFVFHTGDARAQYVPRSEDLPGDSTGDTIVKGVLIGLAVVAVIIIISKVSKSSGGKAEESDSTETSMMLKSGEYHSMDEFTLHTDSQVKEVSRVENINSGRIEPICIVRRNEFSLGLRVLF